MKVLCTEDAYGRLTLHLPVSGMLGRESLDWICVSLISLGEQRRGSLLSRRDILRMGEIICSLDFDHKGRAPG